MPRHDPGGAPEDGKVSADPLTDTQDVVAVAARHRRTGHEPCEVTRDPEITIDGR